MNFHIKKSDKDANNISLTQYMERNNCFTLSVERQFDDRLCKTLYKDKQSAATKRNISRLQSLSLKDKKNTKRKSYLQQPTKPLHYTSNFESTQRVNSNRKSKQETEQESKADFQTKRNSETDENVSLRNSYIQTPEIIEKSKPDIFITENAGFSAY